MRNSARVVVVGGGVVGCSVLYHLAKLGWTDIVLVERDELTSGSTWHAAGGMHTINGDPNIAKLQKYTIDLYKEIEALSGQSTGLHLTGGVMLAATEARFDWMKSIVAKGRYLGIEARIITPERAHELMPLLDPSCFVGALETVVDGHLDPSGTTQAYAKAARKLGVLREHCANEGRDYDEIEKTGQTRFDLGRNGENINQTIEQLHALSEAGFSVAHGSMINVSIPGQLDLLAEQVIPAAEKF